MPAQVPQSTVNFKKLGKSAINRALNYTHAFGRKLDAIRSCSRNITIRRMAQILPEASEQEIAEISPNT